jgi:hypothetical protein
MLSYAVEIGLNHLDHKLLERCFGHPAQFLSCFGWIAAQHVHLGRPEKALIDLHVIFHL